MQRVPLLVGDTPSPRRYPLTRAHAPAATAAGDALDAATLRRALGHFATGVTVVTAETSGGRRAGLTANSFTSVSLEPPLVSVCVASTSAGAGVIRERGAFAVHVLDAAQEDVARRFARRGAQKPDLSSLARSAFGNPVLERYLLLIECALHADYPGGDHRIFVGRVLRLDAVAGADAALTFFRGRYSSLDAG
ncbi:MAG: flavin reductase family protein [Gammaproteobacteria bacterium]|nr:flavin reductase family protein [Gammaproteobacteria bacterium]